jgi:hypothetical protein
MVFPRQALSVSPTSMVAGLFLMVRLPWSVIPQRRTATVLPSRSTLPPTLPPRRSITELPGSAVSVPLVVLPK